ncbi:hypothetical protein DMENIID0001_132090 [Sergentomyia squamirostris]
MEKRKQELIHQAEKLSVYLDKMEKCIKILDESFVSSIIKIMRHITKCILENFQLFRDLLVRFLKMIVNMREGSSYRYYETILENVTELFLAIMIQYPRKWMTLRYLLSSWLFLLTTLPNISVKKIANSHAKRMKLLENLLTTAGEYRNQRAVMVILIHMMQSLNQLELICFTNVVFRDEEFSHLREILKEGNLNDPEMMTREVLNEYNSLLMEREVVSLEITCLTLDGLKGVPFKEGKMWIDFNKSPPCVSLYCSLRTLTGCLEDKNILVYIPLKTIERFVTKENRKNQVVYFKIITNERITLVDVKSGKVDESIFVTDMECQCILEARNRDDTFNIVEMFFKIVQEKTRQKIHEEMMRRQAQGIQTKCLNLVEDTVTISVPMDVEENEPSFAELPSPIEPSLLSDMSIEEPEKLEEIPDDSGIEKEELKFLSDEDPELISSSQKMKLDDFLERDADVTLNGLVLPKSSPFQGFAEPTLMVEAKELFVQPIERLKAKKAIPQTAKKIVKEPEIIPFCTERRRRPSVEEFIEESFAASKNSVQKSLMVEAKELFVQPIERLKARKAIPQTAKKIVKEPEIIPFCTERRRRPSVEEFIEESFAASKNSVQKSLMVEAKELFVQPIERLKARKAIPQTAKKIVKEPEIILFCTERRRRPSVEEFIEESFAASKNSVQKSLMVEAKELFVQPIERPKARKAIPQTAKKIVKEPEIIPFCTERRRRPSAEEFIEESFAASKNSVQKSLMVEAKELFVQPIERLKARKAIPQTAKKIVKEPEIILFCTERRRRPSVEEFIEESFAASKNSVQNSLMVEAKELFVQPIERPKARKAIPQIAKKIVKEPEIIPFCTERRRRPSAEEFIEESFAASKNSLQKATPGDIYDFTEEDLEPVSSTSNDLFDKIRDEESVNLPRKRRLFNPQRNSLETVEISKLSFTERMLSKSRGSTPSDIVIDSQTSVESATGLKKFDGKMKKIQKHVLKVIEKTKKEPSEKVLPPAAKKRRRITKISWPINKRSAEKITVPVQKAQE